jgi:hypothetical protein
MVGGVTPMALLRTSTLLGFNAPVVKGGEIVLPVHMHGGLHGLCATPAVWQAIAVALAPHVGAHGTALEQPAQERRRSTAKASPERIAQYRAAWVSYTSTKALSLRDVAAPLGVSINTISYWFNKFATEPGAPALKPGGKL